MLLRPCEAPHGLETSIQRAVGRQVDELRVLLGEDGLILQGRACTTLARVLAQVEAAQLSGVPVVENRIEVY